MLWLTNDDRVEEVLRKSIELLGLSPRKIEKSEIIFREGEPAEGIVILEEGLIKATKIDEEGRIKVLGMGSGIKKCLGVAGFFTRKEYSATVTAITKCKIYWLSRRDVSWLIKNDCSFAEFIIEILDEKMYTYMEYCTYHSYATTENETARLLYDFAKEFGEKKADGSVTASIRLSDETIGNMIGIKRETVSRTIARLKKDGWIEKKSSQLTILNEELFCEKFKKY